MCDPVSLGIASTAVAVAGTAYSAMKQNQAASAQQAAQTKIVENQNTGFWQRARDRDQQLAATTAAQEEAQRGQQQAFNTQRSQQEEANAQRSQVIASENRSAEQIRAEADAQRQGLLNQTNAQALAASQAEHKAAVTGQVEPAAQQIQAQSPFGSPTGDTTKQSYARKLSEAADNVRSYGQRLAQVSSYTAPLTTVGQAIETERAGIMPTAAANQLLQSGQGVRLLPSQTAYQIAGSEGQAKQQQVEAARQGAYTVAQNQYEGGKAVADLTQANANTAANNEALAAKQRADSASALGNIVAGAGSIGTYAAGRYGDILNSGRYQIGPGAGAIAA